MYELSDGDPIRRYSIIFLKEQTVCKPRNNVDYLTILFLKTKSLWYLVVSL